MSQVEILNEIERLSIFQQIALIKEAVQIIETRLHSMVNTKNAKSPLAEAAQLLLKDYEEDDELTAFSSLDAEEFYATE